MPITSSPTTPGLPIMLARLRLPSKFPKLWAALTRSCPPSRPEKRQPRSLLPAPATTAAPEKTATAPARGSSHAGAVGRIARVTGPVVDIEYPHDSIPEIYNALQTEVMIGGETSTLTLEVAQHLGDDLVRAIALKPTDGLVRGQEVRDTGAQISVPVGDVTKGKVFNVIGEVLNAEPGQEIEITERWPIHRRPPAFDQLES